MVTVFEIIPALVLVLALAFSALVKGADYEKL